MYVLVPAKQDVPGVGGRVCRQLDSIDCLWLQDELNTLLALGEEFARLEEISSTAGGQVADWYAEGGFDENGESLRSRFDAFKMLDSLAADVSAGGGLTRGTEIGLQVYDAQGRRVAWGGWPQTIGRVDRNYLDSGVEIVYSREVSLYRILRHIVPVEDGTGRRL